MSHFHILAIFIKYLILIHFLFTFSIVHVTGVAGGAASGKTSVCDLIIQQLHDQRVVLVNQVFIFYKYEESITF